MSMVKDAARRVNILDEEWSVSSSTVRLPKTAEVVAGRIRKRIIRGELNEGDFLPPENQLMASFAVSRPTLREALRILESENFISVMRGSRSGARVHRPPVENAARYAGFLLQIEGTTVADVYEARLAIEPYVVSKLARSQPDGATDRLRAEVGRLRKMVDDRRYLEFMVAIAEFHRLLVEVSGLKTLLLLTSILQETVARYQVKFFKIHELPEELQRQRASSGLRSFDKVITLIDAGEARAAEAHWHLHLVNANLAWVPAGLKAKVVDVLD
jgi:DNA-binding FadR family transcriptional regulator